MTPEDKSKAGGCLVLIVAWLLCGVLPYGMTFAQHMREFPPDARGTFTCRQHMAFSMGWSFAGGPITLLITPFVTGFAEDGFKWTCP